MKGETGEGAPGGQHHQQQQQGGNFARGTTNSTYRSLRSLTAFPKKSATAATVSQPACQGNHDLINLNQRHLTLTETCNTN